MSLLDKDKRKSIDDSIERGDSLKDIVKNHVGKGAPTPRMRIEAYGLLALFVVFVLCIAFFF